MFSTSTQSKWRSPRSSSRQCRNPSSINKATKRIEVPQFLNDVVDTPVGMQRHVPLIQTLQKTMEVPPLQFIDEVIGILVVTQRQICVNHKVHKTIEDLQLQHTDGVVNVPVVFVVQVPLVQVVDETVEIPQLLFSAILKFGAGTGEKPFAKVKDSITELISRLQGETSSQALDGEISTLQLQLHMYTMRADNVQICAKDKASWTGEITVAGKMDHETVGGTVVQNIGIDSFIDDLSSEVPSHVGKQSGSMHQQHTPGQTDREARKLE